MVDRAASAAEKLPYWMTMSLSPRSKRPCQAPLEPEKFRALTTMAWWLVSVVPVLSPLESGTLISEPVPMVRLVKVWEVCTAVDWARVTTSPEPLTETGKTLLGAAEILTWPEPVKLRVPLPPMAPRPRVVLVAVLTVMPLAMEIGAVMEWLPATTVMPAVPVPPVLSMVRVPPEPLGDGVAGGGVVEGDGADGGVAVQGDGAVGGQARARGEQGRGALAVGHARRPVAGDLPGAAHAHAPLAGDGTGAGHDQVDVARIDGGGEAEGFTGFAGQAQGADAAAADAAGVAGQAIIIAGGGSGTQGDGPAVEGQSTAAGNGQEVAARFGWCCCRRGRVEWNPDRS